MLFKPTFEYKPPAKSSTVISKYNPAIPNHKHNTRILISFATQQVHKTFNPPACGCPYAFQVKATKTGEPRRRRSPDPIRSPRSRQVSVSCREKVKLHTVVVPAALLSGKCKGSGNISLYIKWVGAMDYAVPCRSEKGFLLQKKSVTAIFFFHQLGSLLTTIYFQLIFSYPFYHFFSKLP